MFRKLFNVGVLIACVLSFSGCIFLAAGAAGVGTATWLSEKVTQEIKRPLKRVVHATTVALAQMNITITKQVTSVEVTQIRGKRNTDGKQIWVDIRPIDADHSRLDVRVGMLNGEDEARRIMENIVNKAEGIL